MSYSYSTPLTYGPQQAYPEQQVYVKPKKTSSAIPLSIAGAAVGAVAGGFGGWNRNAFVNKSGDVADTFVKEVQANLQKNLKNPGNDAYTQGENILNKIKSIKSPEELITLFNENKKAANGICKILNKSPEEFVKNITQENLSTNKKTIRKAVETNNETIIQDLKNKITSCWNKTQKKFSKTSGVSDNFYKAIEDSTRKCRNKNALITGGLTALGLGAAIFTICKLVERSKKEKS